jgi:hypothetical protein
MLWCSPTLISAGSRTPVPVPVVVGESLGFSLSYYAVGYDWGTPPTSYSYRSTSSLYLYNVIQHLILWLVVIWMPALHWYLLSETLTLDTHTLHPHSRSSSYLYNAIQHLLQWILVIRMQPYPNICSLGPESGFPRCRSRSHCGSYDWDPPHTSYSYQVYFICI